MTADVTLGPDDAVTGPEPGIDLAHLRHVVHTRVFGDGQGVVVGRYDLLERIGSGAMGVVYAAHDRELDRRVALKVLRAGGSGVEARLVREAQALARVSHPNVVHIYEVGQHQGEVFLAMELVAGTPLRQWAAAHDRPVVEVLARLVEVGRGLAAAHAHGVVHRDVKPDNMVVGSDGRARIIDFGLAAGVASAARPAEPGESESAVLGPTAALAGVLTTTGLVIGTPAYMAPEQLAGGSPDPKADQFSFAAAVYEALTGRLPFEAGTVGERVEAIAAASLSWPAGCAASTQVRRVVARGLASAPDDRFASVTALVDTLAAAAVRPRRRRWPAFAAATVVLSATAAFGLAQSAATPGVESSAAAALASQSAPAQTGVDGVQIIAQARAKLASDPTAAWELLASLPADDPAWANEAWSIAADAWQAGVATQVITVHGAQANAAGGEIDGVVNGRQLARASDCSLTLVDDHDVVTWRSPADCSPPQGQRVTRTEAAVVFVRDGTLVWSDGERERTLTTPTPTMRWALTRSGVVASVDQQTLVVWDPDVEHPRTYDLSGSLAEAGLGPGNVSAIGLPNADHTQAALFFSPEGAARQRGWVDLRTGACVWFDWDVVAFRRGSEVQQGLLQRRDGRLERWPVIPGRRRLLSSESFQASSLTIADDGRWMAALQGERGVALWRGDEDEPRWLPWPDVRRLTPSPASHWLAVSTPDWVRVVSPSGQTVRTIRHPDRASLEWIDDHTLRTATFHGEHRVWSMPQAPRLDGHRAGVSGVAFAGPDTVVSVAADRSVVKWNLVDGTGTVLETDTSAQPYEVETSSDGRLALVAVAGAPPVAWDVVEETRLPMPEVGPGAVRFWSDSTVVFTRGGVHHEWDFATGAGRELPTPGGDCRLLDAVAGRLAVSQCGEQLRVWSDADGPRFTTPHRPKVGKSVRLDPRGVFVQTRFFDGHVEVERFDLATGTVAPVLDAPISRSRFHPIDPRTLSRSAHDLVDRRLDTGLLRRRGLDDIADISAVAFSADGRRVVYGTRDGDLRVALDAPPMDPVALHAWVAARPVVRRLLPSELAP